MIRFMLIFVLCVHLGCISKAKGEMASEEIEDFFPLKQKNVSHEIS